jgi:hypothetical protein
MAYIAVALNESQRMIVVPSLGRATRAAAHAPRT